MITRCLLDFLASLNRARLSCIQLNIFKMEEELILVPEKILPTEEISFHVGMKIRSKEYKTNKRRGIISLEDHYDNLNLDIGSLLRKFMDKIGIEPSKITGGGFYLGKDRSVLINTYVKSKIEFKFDKKHSADLEELIKRLGIVDLEIKLKADIESWNIKNPSPAIDCRTENDFDSIMKICTEWIT